MGVLSLCIPQTATADGYLQETGTNTHLHCKYLGLGRRVKLQFQYAYIALCIKDSIFHC